MMKKEFSTQRLFLNELTEDDAQFILELTNTIGWIQFIGDRNIHSKEQAMEYIHKIDNNPDAKYWKVNLKQNQEAIGIITLVKRDYLDDFDIGFAFLPQFVKKGYAFEATKIVLNQVINQTKNQCIYAVTQLDNIDSINLLRKLGMNRTRMINVEGKELAIYSISVDQLDHINRASNY